MPVETIIGVILAGGAGRRMGGRKPLRLLHGRPLLQHAIARIRPQACALLLSAAADDGSLSTFGLPVVPDHEPGLGPIGGILTGLSVARRVRPDCAAVLFVPADCPFLPPDLAAVLECGMDWAGAPLACAASAGRLHPTVSLWSVDLAPALRNLVSSEGVRAAREAWDRLGGISVGFPDRPYDPFFNVNDAGDLAAAARLGRA